MQPTASTMPYMVCPGNHEAIDQFTSYVRRLPMPAAASNATVNDAKYYSWDAGCIHFVSLSSESVLNGPEIDEAQIEWLKADLAAFAPRRAAAMAQRAANPFGPAAAQCTLDAPSFLVVYMHRPMYCSTAGKQGEQRCGQQAPFLRSLVEDVFVQFGVDLVYSGHVHASVAQRCGHELGADRMCLRCHVVAVSSSCLPALRRIEAQTMLFLCFLLFCFSLAFSVCSYERSAPVVNGTIDSRGPVYLMNGSGGNREGETNNWQTTPPPCTKPPRTHAHAHARACAPCSGRCNTAPARTTLTACLLPPSLFLSLLLQTLWCARAATAWAL